jgi:hypothetical protein
VTAILIEPEIERQIDEAETRIDPIEEVRETVTVRDTATRNGNEDDQEIGRT